MPVAPIHGVGSPPPSGAAAAAPGGAAGLHRPTDLVDVSPAGVLLRRLDALLHESPERFRAVTAGVAGRLGEQARAAEPQRALLLTQLAARFGAAAAAGSPAPLAAEVAAATPRPPAGTALAVPQGGAAPVTAALAAAAASAGAAPRPVRAPLRANYRGRAARAGGPGATGGEPGGGLLGALLSALAGVVDAALEAALLDAPPGPAGDGPPDARP